MNIIELIAPGARVTGWHQLHGGIGNVMHRIDVMMPSGSETGFVLRQAIPESGHPTDLPHEALTLEALRPTPVPSPELLWLDQDGEVFGRPALAMTLMDGTIRSVDATTDPAVVRALADALITLQWVVDLDPFDHLGGCRDVDAFLDEYEALRGPVADLDWWCLQATLRTGPGVASWLPGWHEVGIDIDLATVHANLAAWTDRHLAQLRG